MRARVAEERAHPPQPATPATPEAAPAPAVVVRERTVIQPAWYRVEYRRSTASTVVPWVLLGVGGALGILGAIEGAVASADINTLDAVNSGAQPWSASAQTSLDRAGGAVGGAYLFAGLGGAMALSGALWLILRGPGERVVTNTPPALTVAPFGAGLAVGGAL